MRRVFTNNLLATRIPRIIAHRGASAVAPENTLASFRKAKELGAEWVEFDVKESKDGILLIMHDETLDRTTNGTGAIAHKHWEELRGLSAGHYFKSEPLFYSEPIPTLEATIKVLKELQLGAKIEIKPCPGREVSTAHAVAKFIGQLWPSSLPPPIISSFSMEALLVAYRTEPQLIRGALFEDVPENWKQIMFDTKCSTIHVDHQHLTSKTAREIADSGFPLLTYTVNDRVVAKNLFKWGVSAVFSDLPWVEVDF